MYNESSAPPRQIKQLLRHTGHQASSSFPPDAAVTPDPNVETLRRTMGPALEGQAAMQLVVPSFVHRIRQAVRAYMAIAEGMETVHSEVSQWLTFR